MAEESGFDLDALARGEEIEWERFWARLQERFRRLAGMELGASSDTARVHDQLVQEAVSETMGKVLDAVRKGRIRESVMGYAVTVFRNYLRKHAYGGREFVSLPSAQAYSRSLATEIANMEQASHAHRKLRRALRILLREMRREARAARYEFRHSPYLHLAALDLLAARRTRPNRTLVLHLERAGRTRIDPSQISRLVAAAKTRLVEALRREAGYPIPDFDGLCKMGVLPLLWGDCDAGCLLDDSEPSIEPHRRDYRIQRAIHRREIACPLCAGSGRSADGGEATP